MLPREGDGARALGGMGVVARGLLRAGAAALARLDPRELADSPLEHARFARRFLDVLEGEPSALARLARLRAFHDSTHQEKLATLA